MVLKTFCGLRQRINPERQHQRAYPKPQWPSNLITLSKRMQKSFWETQASFLSTFVHKDFVWRRQDRRGRVEIFLSGSFRWNWTHVEPDRLAWRSRVGASAQTALHYGHPPSRVQRYSRVLHQLPQEVQEDIWLAWCTRRASTRRMEH